MGMYDTFALKKPVRCPGCGRKLKDFQTKSLSNTLTVFKEGKDVELFGLKIL